MSESASGEAGSGSAPSDKDSSVCPTCGDEFTSGRGVKIHHKMIHGESIAGMEVECHYCDSSFRKKPAEVRDYDRHFCPGSDCRDKWASEHYTGDGNPSWDGGAETRQCDWCGGDITRHTSEFHGDRHYCNYDCMHKWQSEHNTGEDNPAWKGGEVTCSWCGEELDRDLNQIERSENHFCGDKDCRGKWQSRNLVGENHPHWMGGNPNYYGSNWPARRRKALQRDGYECQDCGSDEELHVHHIHPVRDFDDPNDANALLNLVTFCRSCHWKWEGWYIRPDPRG